jgi:penicillin-binding protein 1A
LAPGAADARSPAGWDVAKPGRGAEKRREPSFESGAGALDVRLAPEDRAAPADDAVHARRSTKTPSAKSSSTKSSSAKSSSSRRVEPKFDLPGRSRPPAPPKKGRTARRGGRRSGLFRLVYWGAVLSIWAALAVAGLFAWVAMHLPPIQALEIPKRPPAVQINSLDGKVFANRGEMGGAALAIKEMPANLPNAFIAIEDRRFRSHHGVDPVGLFRAVLANLLHRGISQGGSTITQQLAKNLFLTPERHLMRKLQEVVLALWLEHKFSKNEILELYLNRVYFGSGAYGVEAAAQRYFGKSARNASVSEAALLAGLVKSPSRLAPTRNFDGAEERARVVLAAMAEAKLITDDTARTAMASPPKIVKPSAGGSSNYVADWVMDVLNDLIGRVDEDIVIDTSIDAAMQAVAERALIEEVAQKGEKFGVQQGALVAMTTDGAVRALVGGRSYAENQFNRAVAARRQPGSAFKPFVYLTALEHGLTPETVREDRPIEIKNWRPENYGHEYYGPVTLTQALAMSLNTVSVRLTLEFGPTNVVRTAHRLGITSKLEPNASIALGTSEVSVLELVSAYVPFANGGNAIIPHVVERVRTLRGKTIYARPTPTLGRVIDPRYVAMMNTMMRETLTSGTARKADLPGWPAAGKTGTSQDFRDAWFIGYTSQLVTGVWFGNDDSSPTRHATGGALPVEVWSRFMKAAHQGVPVSTLPVGTGGFASLADPSGPLPPTGLPPAGLPPAGAPPAPLPPAGVSQGPPMSSHAPTAPQPAGAAARPRDAVRPSEGTIDGWLMNRLFPGR